VGHDHRAINVILTQETIPTLFFAGGFRRQEQAITANPMSMFRRPKGKQRGSYKEWEEENFLLRRDLGIHAAVCRREVRLASGSTTDRLPITAKWLAWGRVVQYPGPDGGSVSPAHSSTTDSSNSAPSGVPDLRRGEEQQTQGRNVARPSRIAALYPRSCVISYYLIEETPESKIGIPRSSDSFGQGDSARTPRPANDPITMRGY